MQVIHNIIVIANNSARNNTFTREACRTCSTTSPGEIDVGQSLDFPYIHETSNIPFSSSDCIPFKILKQTLDEDVEIEGGCFSDL